MRPGILLLLATLLSYVSPLLAQNKCVKLDGKADYIKCSKKFTDLKLPFTISAWVNIDPSSFFLGPVFSSTNCFSAYSGLILLADKNYIHVQYGDGFGSKHHAYRRGKEAIVKLPPGQWHHVAAIVKSNSDIELYLDGVNAGGELTGSSLHPMNSDAPEGFASIGYVFSNDKEYYYKGMIDDIRLYNIALSPDEIGKSMCNTLTGKEKGLIGYWTFDGKTTDSPVGTPELKVAAIPCVTNSEEK